MNEPMNERMVYRLFHAEAWNVPRPWGVEAEVL